MFLLRRLLTKSPEAGTKTVMQKDISCSTIYSWKLLHMHRYEGQSQVWQVIQQLLCCHLKCCFKRILRGAVATGLPASPRPPGVGVRGQRYLPGRGLSPARPRAPLEPRAGERPRRLRLGCGAVSARGGAGAQWRSRRLRAQEGEA